MSAVVLFAGDLAACEQVVAEVGGGVTVRLGDVGALDEGLVDGGEDNLHVTPEGDLLDVLEVVGYLGLPGHGVPAVHLGKPAESLPHGVALALFRGHEHHVAYQLRPRPYHGHVTLEDVEEFGEFVEAGAAQELAVTGQAHVVGEQVARLVALVCHGAELDELEDLLVLAGAGLREEGIPAHFNCAEDGEHDEQRAQAQDSGQGATEVQDSFEEAGVHIG